MASVMVKLGDDPRIVPLPAEPITVGRSSQNAIAILDSSLSRVHCELRKVDGAVLVRDLGSRNGTIVNGETVREKKLQSGDKVDVGICRIVVWIEKGGVKLEVSAGKAGAAVKSEGPDTAKLRAETETHRRMPVVVAGALPDVAGWGKRAGGGGKWAVVGLVAAVVVIVVVGLAIKGGKKKAAAAAADPWKTFDYAAVADLGKDWKAAPGSPSGLALAAGRDGQGLELTRQTGERGLAEALGPAMPVEARKAYRLSAWCRATGGQAGLRVGWIGKDGEEPFAWSGTGLSAEEGERGGTWLVPEGAERARLACVVAGGGGKAVFDDVDFAEAPLPDRPPVVGRAVQAAFEAPGVFFLATRGGSLIRAVVGLEASDATCAIGAKKTAGGGTYELASPIGGAAVAVAEERDGEGEGFVVRWTAKGAGVQLALGTGEAEVNGRVVSEPVKTGQATVGRLGSRVVLELRPEADVAMSGGHVVVRFPTEEFEIAFLPEAGSGNVGTALAGGQKFETARQYGQAIAFYEELIEKNPKGDAALGAEERLAALRKIAEDALGRARYRRSDAEFTGKPAGCDEATLEYLMVEKDFDGTEYAAQARAEREATELLRTQLAADLADAEVGQLLKLAQAYFDEGRLALARAYCEAVQDRSSDPNAAALADSLLQRIDAKEKE